MLFPRFFFLRFANFTQSDWPKAQNINKRADWSTFFPLVAPARQFKTGASDQYTD